MAPSWPLVSQEEGLFQGTFETLFCELSTSLRVVGVVALVLAQPDNNTATGSKSKRDRNGFMRSVKHIVAHLNIAFYAGQDIANGRISFNRRDLDLA